MSVDGTHVPVYFKSIRKMAAAFATIFNNIWLVRENADGTINHKQKVPIIFGPKEQWFARDRSKNNTQSDVDGKVEFGQLLPAMAFQIGSPQYDSSRQLDQKHIHKKLIQDIRYKQMNPAPYNIPFTLDILSKNMEDGLMLLEQILPLFQPQLNIKVREVPEMDVYTDLTLLLDSTNLTDNFTEGYEENRAITWTLSFTMKGYIYPPMKANPDITKVIVELFDVDTTIKNEQGLVLDLDNVSPETLAGRTPVLRYEEPE